MCLGVASKAQAKTLYLNTGGSSLWETDGANKFAIWHWQGSNAGAWSDWMTNVEGNVWKVDISDASDKVIFCRYNTTATSFDWGKVWNQTSDLSIPSGKDLYTITGWGDDEGEWSKYGEDPGPGPVTPTEYDKAVPSQCADVMLQAFYWDSYQDKGFGNTQWQTLEGQASEIGQYFQLVWLPPSHASSGGLGYIPSNYSTQSSSALGKKSYLVSLISALHNNGVKVIADIVINHCGNKSNACDYNNLNFGEYGIIAPQTNWMTSNDEGVTKYGCSGGSNADDGQNGNDANYEAARDWDHKNPNVQNMCRAYLKWMKNVMLYDGFRYDYAGGFHTSHLNDYNSASKPYFSVMEYWDGNVNTLKQRIDDASQNTLAFDFPMRYATFKDGIAKGNYNACRNAGLRGQGYSKYAVTFIDNHDSFQRSGQYDESDISYSKSGASVNNESLMMRCNAYILSMPGVPCVFYPHWVKYKENIKKMITARRRAGIHSESSVTEEGGSGYYRATIQGKYGSVKLMLGTAAGDAAPSGYTQAIKGSDYAMYYTGNGPLAIEDVEAEPLDKTKPMYNIMGQQVDGSYRGVVIQNGHKYLINP